ncbi:Long chain acyl-CoA synthetase 7 peroxisomal [Datura stramonium]|uniref:Long chain acyl-CoA synthetase 7 peroxisomal n=1 Tax=Datura stramonium TaxID=4076 RepID=A0ABS8S6B0_DATST|nr:Long chain acyl-CoA synthetase 7 peroxisomal [Datura stramonium]
MTLLGPDAVKYIVNHADVQAIFCVPTTARHVVDLFQEIPSVRLIVVVGGIDEHLPSLPSSRNEALILYKASRSGPQQYATLLSSGLKIYCYHMLYRVVLRGHQRHDHAIKFYPSDIYISYLPLAHIYERANQITSAYYGVAVGFYQGDNLKLMDDLVTLRPTIFSSVHRLYNRIYAGITNAVQTSGILKQRLFNAAYNSKKQAVMNGRKPSPMWDRLVFNKIKDKLGGRVRLMTSGASPLSPDVMEFLRVDNLTGHVGSPNPACEVKLVDVPEMSYTSEDKPHPRGEICVREVIDDDGWCILVISGLWLPGALKIIDRKKNIFKLAQGEYIAPEKIENVYAKCKFIAQCFVYGDSFNSSLVAVVCVEPDVLKEWASSEGIKYENLEQLCNDQARAAVLAEMDAVGREAQLRGFEQSRNIDCGAFHNRKWSLTPHSRSRDLGEGLFRQSNI